MNERCAAFVLLIFAIVSLFCWMYYEPVEKNTFLSPITSTNASDMLGRRNNGDGEVLADKGEAKRTYETEENITKFYNISSDVPVDAGIANISSHENISDIFQSDEDNREVRKLNNLKLNPPTGRSCSNDSSITQCFDGKESVRMNNSLVTRHAESTIPSYYITINWRGRLGNQMFQYAALFATARRHPGWSPILSDDDRLQPINKVFGDSLSIKPATLTGQSFQKVKVGKKADSGVRKLLELPKVNIVLTGYFQSHKYFEQVKNDLRNEFVFQSEVTANVSKYFESIAPEEWQNKTFVRVGIHVRRTDIASKLWQESGWLSPPPSYFSHAMDYFEAKYDRVQFIVASDDLEWCRKYIVGDQVHYSNMSYAEDLAILASSNHVIISVGTFSWWAGWLCKGTTIYYGQPPPENTYFGKLFANNSWIPPKDEYNHWVPLV